MMKKMSEWELFFEGYRAIINIFCLAMILPLIVLIALIISWVKSMEDDEK